MGYGDFIGRKAVERVINTVQSPLREASLFYALYYLTEIEGVTEAAFDFNERRARLHEDFWFYGLFSVMRELRNFPTAFRVDGERWESYDPQAQARMIDERFENRMARQIARQIEKVPTEGEFVSSTQEVISTLNVADSLFDVKRDPETFLTGVAYLFDYEDDRARWDREFGGKAWGGICRHLKRRGGLGQTVWVNQSWAIQHNNSVWLDKFNISAKDMNAARAPVQHLLGYTNIPGVITVFNQVLPALLDARKAGEMGPVFLFAEAYNSEVSINLRRYRIGYGIELPMKMVDRDIRLTLPFKHIVAAEMVTRLMQKYVEEVPEGRRGLLNTRAGMTAEDIDRAFEAIEPLAKAAKYGESPYSTVTLTFGQARAVEKMLDSYTQFGQDPTLVPPPEGLRQEMMEVNMESVFGATRALDIEREEFRDNFAPRL